MAALVKCLPLDCAINRAASDDAQWTLEAQLVAYIANQINGFMYSLSDPKRRGPRPAIIGDSAMREKLGGRRKLDAVSMPIDQLMHELSKPRR